MECNHAAFSGGETSGGACGLLQPLRLTLAINALLRVYAIRLSIAAAVVIAKPSRVMTMRPRWDGAGRIQGRDVAIRCQFLGEPETGTRLSQRRAMVAGTPGRRRRRRFAVRTCASAARDAVSAAQIAGNHAQISRSDDPGVEALEIRYPPNGRGLPAGGDVGLATTICVPDIRWRLQGFDHGSLSGVVATWCAVHHLCADRVPGRRWRSVVARTRTGDRAGESPEPGDGPYRAAFQYREHLRKIP